jgi:aminopeptidase-like protein
MAAFNLTCVGDERSWSFLPSRSGNTYADKVALHTLKHHTENFDKYSWSDRGSDEKMYCAPFIDLPMVSVMRSKHGTYPEYHTSLDTMGEVVTEKGLQASLDIHKKMVFIIENDGVPVTQILGEPQLGKRGLYPSLSHNRSSETVRTRLDLISYADGQHSLLDIAEKCELTFDEVWREAEILSKHDIIDVKND